MKTISRQHRQVAFQTLLNESTSPEQQIRQPPLTLTARMGRLWAMLRYYNKRQMAQRLKKRLRSRVQPYGIWPDRIAVKDDLAVGHSDLLPEWSRSKLALHKTLHGTKRAEQFLQGRFCFLGHTCELRNPIDWRLCDAPGTPHLWRFYLHYQDYLLDFACSDKPEQTEFGWELISEWIDGNSLRDLSTRNDAWHAYCISRRMVNWIVLCSLTPPPADLNNTIEQSLAQQAEFLHGNLETDLGGNHLLENVRGLVVASTFFSGKQADRWLRTAEAILPDALDKQILDHGEHFERAPGYHLEMIELIADLSVLLGQQNPHLARSCAAAANKMIQFLHDLLHPDQDLPLLGDSCLSPALPAGERVAMLQSRLPTLGTNPNQDPLLPETANPLATDDTKSPMSRRGNYWMFRDENDFLLFDAGPVGTDSLPAHAHCDLLHLEASAGGQRLFVDSGVYDYEDSSMRHYCRSTAAHNTLEIDRTNQCDVWSKFRMGFRGWPTSLQTARCGPFQLASSSHNAYRKLGVPSVQRVVGCRRGGTWIVADTAYPNPRTEYLPHWFRSGKSHRQHTYVNRLHLHPQAEARRASSTSIQIRLGDQWLYWHLLTPAELELATGWYCQALGHRQLNQVITWTQRTGSRYRSCWVISRDAEAYRQIDLRPHPTGRVELCWQEENDLLVLWPI